MVTKFIFSTTEDLQFSTLNFNKECKYLKDTKEEQTEEAKHILDPVTYSKNWISHAIL